MCPLRFGLHENPLLKFLPGASDGKDERAHWAACQSRKSPAAIHIITVIWTICQN